MGSAAIKADEHYSYRQYRTWPEYERWELIEGTAYSMSPAPRRKHQRLIGKLFHQIDTFLEGKPCQPYFAPVDVFLTEVDDQLDDIDTVVQPDLFVVCNHAKLLEEGIKGAPDLVIEILSPGTALRDQTEKRDLYEKHGVREYWVVNPDTLEAFIYRLSEGAYGLPGVADLKLPTPVTIFEGLSLKVRKEDL
jgi:Uma2 family endonuclease